MEKEARALTYLATMLMKRAFTSLNVNVKMQSYHRSIKVSASLLAKRRYYEAWQTLY